MAKQRVYTKKEPVFPDVADEPRYVWVHARPSVYTHDHQEVFGARMSQPEIQELLEKYPYMGDFFEKK
jgi:hypothetical protein